MPYLATTLKPFVVIKVDNLYENINLKLGRSIESRPKPDVRNKVKDIISDYNSGKISSEHEFIKLMREALHLTKYYKQNVTGKEFINCWNSMLSVYNLNSIQIASLKLDIKKLPKNVIFMMAINPTHDHYLAKVFGDDYKVDDSNGYMYLCGKKVLRSFDIFNSTYVKCIDESENVVETSDKSFSSNVFYQHCIETILVTDNVKPDNLIIILDKNNSKDLPDSLTSTYNIISLENFYSIKDLFDKVDDLNNNNELNSVDTYSYMPRCTIM